MRRLGVDPGARRVGLALSHGESPIATPYKTLQVASMRGAARLLAREIEAHEIAEVVIGLALNMDGSEGAAARRCRELASSLSAVSAVPVVLWDERWSTAAAERSLRELGLSAKQQRPVVDQAAACWLLQGYLDSKRGTTWHDEEADAAPPAEPATGARRPRRGRRR